MLDKGRRLRFGTTDTEKTEGRRKRHPFDRPGKEGAASPAGIQDGRTQGKSPPGPERPSRFSGITEKNQGAGTLGPADGKQGYHAAGGSVKTDSGHTHFEPDSGDGSSVYQKRHRQASQRRRSSLRQKPDVLQESTHLKELTTKDAGAGPEDGRMVQNVPAEQKKVMREAGLRQKGIRPGSGIRSSEPSSVSASTAKGTDNVQTAGLQNGSRYTEKAAGNRHISTDSRHPSVQFVEHRRAGAAPAEDSSLPDRKLIRRMQKKKQQFSMRERLSSPADRPLFSFLKKRKEDRPVFMPAGDRKKKWLLLLLTGGIAAALIVSSVSAVALLGSGIAGGASAAADDNHTSMYAGSAIRQEIVSYAEAFIGRGRYVWGGNDLGTPENPGSGTDCSGFVQQVFLHFGISLPRTSYADVNAGVGIDYSEARPGDIIVYDGHVAIYAGDGQIVQAANEEIGMCMGSATYAPMVAVRNVIPAEMDLAYVNDPVELDEESRHLLATIVYHESGNQSYESKVAVAAEALNRVRSSHFPNTVYKVLNQKNQYCNTDTEPAFRRMYNSTLPEDCWKAVEDAMNGADPTGGMCFHCTNDYWAANYAGLGWPNLVIDDQTFHNWGHEAGYFNQTGSQ